MRSPRRGAGGRAGASSAYSRRALPSGITFSSAAESHASGEIFKNASGPWELKQSKDDLRNNPRGREIFSRRKNEEVYFSFSI
jgi:hypothetical protein